MERLSDDRRTARQKAGAASGYRTVNAYSVVDVYSCPGRSTADGNPDSLGELRKHMQVKTHAAVIGELDKQVTGMPGPDILKVLEAA